MGRTVFVGDVHGCRDELSRLLDRVKFAGGDRLVFVGDLVARGPDSLGVLDVVRQTGALVVRGNHEERLLLWKRGRDAWLRGAALRGFAAEEPLSRLHREIAHALRPVDWSLLESTPLWIDLPEHGVRVVHAGVVPGVPFEQQKPVDLLRVRTVRVRGLRGRATRVLWGTIYAGPPHVIFGHNAAPGLQLHPWATGLDTRCVYGERLTALVLDSGQKVPRSLKARVALMASEPAARMYYDFTKRAPDLLRT